MKMELANLDCGNITVFMIDFADVQDIELNEINPDQEEINESR
jgi:hypothetical protein